MYSNTSLRNRHLISPNVGDWHDHILKTKLWDYKEFWTCRMWVVWIFFVRLHKLITKIFCYEKKNLVNGTTVFNFNKKTWKMNVNHKYYLISIIY